ncbi:beta-ketoacyl-[acyl-carrier-protein] synthase family protein [Pseudodesulfovibrio sediminis]|uniref:Beta-ketoacyl-ACP synthase II n=1 Tax=Pseudodesulfovibrio sediminis TaxID=2810563 RepID=A0ABM7P6D6_9BACT|nr:beta-ketoacyl-[acyl-carrier-protein] synthase family protein [Pseudodesulfovibrio sediminis]BCS88436.1 beta-ketoacyl-ACP synthase II [Pseudodesulfovibrio sediminis]
MRRVVITGMGALSPYGEGLEAFFKGLESGESCIRSMPELLEVSGLTPSIAGQVPTYNAKAIPRKFRRTMSPMSIFAVLAATEAIAMAELDDTTLENGRTGLVVGSTVGSVQALQSIFTHYLDGKSVDGVKSTEFFKIMNHSCATNIAQFFGVRGRVLAPSAACSTGCQTIGIAMETIAMGKQDVMLCGGADELHPLTVGTFDILQAASTGYNVHPTETPRPFDKDRDGIVCSEGAGIVVLESLDHAKARNAPILAELIGFATTSDPSNPASPSASAIAQCMELALDEAGTVPEDVDYVNAHATGTDLGDIAESQAIASLMGKIPAVSSLKGYMGHTMAASGALETIATLYMLKNGLVFPTRNLLHVSPGCEGVNHITAKTHRSISIALKNNFALGGINTSLVIRRYND